MTRARRPATARRPTLPAVALRLVPATTRVAATEPTAARSTPGGVYPVAEAAQGRAQYAANRDGSRLHWPITGPATMLLLWRPR